MAADGRTRILERLRRASPGAGASGFASGPGYTGPISRPTDAVADFCQALEKAGGTWQRGLTRADLATALAATPEWRAARNRISLVAEVATDLHPSSARERPVNLADCGFALIEGEVGVAENGAVFWRAPVDDPRAFLFLAQHVGLVLSVADIVDTLHEAYARITFEGRGFAAFLAGPSKTADIEQALVVGAHGARSLRVFLLDR